VLPVRVRNFESVCQRIAEPAAVAAPFKPDLKKRASMTAKLVKAALESNPRVWVYPVSSFHGKKEAGNVAVSRDYLQETVAERIAGEAEFKAIADGAQWLKDHLPVEIETVLNRHKVRSGYAVLAGVARQVWVLPQTQIKLDKGKAVRSQAVEVVERI
jgi:hypothetical protein